MHKIIISTLCIICFIIQPGYSQNGSSLFLGGYDNNIGQLPFGGNKVDFISGQSVVGQEFRIIDFKFTGTNITDSLGNLLFTTNGSIIMNNSNDTMDNGKYLNPSIYTTNWIEGLRLWQANIILPYPDSTNVYSLIHNTAGGGIGGGDYARFLFHSKIDMSLNGGEGKVTILNNVFYSDTLSPVGLTACRHGNGRDWWIVNRKVNSSTFHFYLLSPFGVSHHHSQDIGYRVGFNQYSFSPDGTRYGSYGTDDNHFEVFDFDRCSGTFSNYREVHINDSMVGTGAAFSPNSQYLYGSSVQYLYQIDASSNQPDTTLKTVAVWDGTYSPNPPFAATFFIQQLGNDGKIYISSGNGTLMMHTIESPDLGDTLCNVQQHSVALPTYNVGTIPNFPNFKLGAMVGSPCDTIVGIHELNDKNINLTIKPNPTSGRFEVNYELPQNEKGAIEVINILGEVVYSNYLPQWSSVHRLNLEVSDGLYQIVITTSKSRESKKILIQ